MRSAPDITATSNRHATVCVVRPTWKPQNPRLNNDHNRSMAFAHGTAYSTVFVHSSVEERISSDILLNVYSNYTH